MSRLAVAAAIVSVSTTLVRTAPRQTPPAPPAVPNVAGVALRDIASAEAEGASYPRGRADLGQLGQDVGDAGTIERKCVDTREAGSVRSGDILAGPFSMFKTAWQQGRTKIWWMPQDFNVGACPGMWQACAGTELIVRATKLDHPEERTVQRFWDHARSSQTSTYFFPTGASLPSAGRWMIVATTGRNWGCFLVDAQ